MNWLFFVLVVPLWFGHRVSSAWLAYATPAYRPLLATQRLRFVVAPLAIAVACFDYVLDRAAFRFSSPEVRLAARGLLASTRG